MSQQPQLLQRTLVDLRRAPTGLAALWRPPEQAPHSLVYLRTETL